MTIQAPRSTPTPKLPLNVRQRDVDDRDVDDLEQRRGDDRDADDGPAPAVLDDRAFVRAANQALTSRLT